MTRNLTNARFQPRIEALEQRDLMAAAIWLENGVLRVDGRSEGDRIVISTVAVPLGSVSRGTLMIRAQVQEHDRTVLLSQDFPSYNVSSIRIDSFDGDDVLWNNTAIPSILNGGDGRDFLAGGSAADQMYGGEDVDYLYGRVGNDLLYGGSGADFLAGGQGEDNLYGQSGDDILIGGSGDDDLIGGTGQDVLHGDQPRTTSYFDSAYFQETLISEDTGADGDDYLSGGSDRDDLYGGGGDDELHGGSGCDALWGDAGSDTLAGGTGIDSLYDDVGDWESKFIFDAPDLINDLPAGFAGVPSVIETGSYVGYFVLVV